MTTNANGGSPAAGDAPRIPPTWPEGVIARYLTTTGATVDVAERVGETHWPWVSTCQGCTQGHEDRYDSHAHEWAQAHAERCRALPRPEVQP